ncbi:hypothetical protein CK203_013752 [Vitis vinifera]|uniref:Reverse transcriptase domain-containing protein n=1 Tax=Vitis vinifera TaxID=29760 RepID=A0A438JJL6_VITVI|nr:hypothetical protein CK203_013752 [Vitis vinifera]
MANARARKNFLSKVNINGNSLTSAEDIKDGVCRTYRTLLAETDDWRPRMGNLQFRVLGSERATSLEEPFSEKEVFEALCNLSRDKVPELKDFRPISLVGSLYKLLAKVLANRLKQAVGEVVSEYQHAFIQNRQILDAALIANEAVDSRLKVNIPRLILKLDIEKAFDHVNWDCLVSVMSKMGTRGLRQEDPLFPYLFLLVMEVLSQLFFRARSEGFIEGFKVGNTNGIEMDLLHLLFADDTLLFCKANRRVDYLENIVSVLGCRIGKLPSSYLGLPLGAPFKSSRVWEVCVRLENIQRDFLWGGGALKKKPHLVNWSAVCIDMRQGGLGICSLVALNKALLGKWN